MEEKKKKNIEEINDPDDKIDLKLLNELLEDESRRSKNRLLIEIEEMGDKYLEEINKKNQIKEQQKLQLIPFILAYSKFQYNEKELTEYSFEDVQQIYEETKHNKKSKFIKFVRFLFGID